MSFHLKEPLPPCADNMTKQHHAMNFQITQRNAFNIETLQEHGYFFNRTLLFQKTKCMYFSQVVT
jgi:alpha-glucuronidase